MATKLIRPNKGGLTNDILNGKFFCFYDQKSNKVLVIAHLLESMGTNLLYYATIYDERFTDGRELGQGLVTVEDVLYRNDDRMLLFDTKEALLVFVESFAKPKAAKAAKSAKSVKPAKKVGKAK